MNFLAALLKDSEGNEAVRDIVQFVPFDRYLESGIEALKEAVLEEIPDQLLAYMHIAGLRPNRR